MARTHNGGRIFHGEASARTATGLWRDGDVFIVRSTGAIYERTDGAWVQSTADVTHSHVDGSLLPNGSNEGDFLRWDATGGAWEVAAEPLEMYGGQIVLTPAAAAALDVEGGIFYKSTDKSVYVCTDDT